MAFVITNIVFIYFPKKALLAKFAPLASFAAHIYLIGITDHATNFLGPEISVTGKSIFCLLSATFMRPGSHRK